MVKLTNGLCVQAVAAAQYRVMVTFREEEGYFRTQPEDMVQFDSYPFYPW